MLKERDAVLVGVSGGPDSMALLYAMRDLSDVYRIRLGVAHLNHGLRQKDSDRDVEFVVCQAEKLNLPCYVEKKDIAAAHKKTGGSLEEAARTARYDFLFKTAATQGFDRIAVGHQQDDNAELILLYLLRGSGAAGLSGIPPVREKIIRPLIQTSRAEILDFLKINKIPYVIDRSNADQHFIRNRIRHQLLPLLKQRYNPKIVESLNRLGMILQADEDWIDDHAYTILDEITFEAGPDRRVLSRKELVRLPVGLQQRVIRKAIFQVKGNLRRISYAHTEMVKRLAENTATGLCIDLPDRIRVCRRADHLVITREKQSLRSLPHSEIVRVCPEFAYTILQSDIPDESGPPGKPLYIKETDALLNLKRIDRCLVKDLRGFDDRIAYLDWDRLKFPLVIRNHRPGDRFTPLGMKGSQKLKKFFTDHKIDSQKRRVTPVISDHEGIVWVCGIRISERIKVTETTATVLKAEFLEAGFSPKKSLKIFKI